MPHNQVRTAVCVICSVVGLSLGFLTEGYRHQCPAYCPSHHGDTCRVYNDRMKSGWQLAHSAERDPADLPEVAPHFTLLFDGDLEPVEGDASHPVCQ